MTFNPTQSPLSRDAELLQYYVELLQRELGAAWEICGILEIGSYAKGEAVPSSDIDTRVYVSSSDAYMWQRAASRQSDAQVQETERMFEAFLSVSPLLPRDEVEWFSWNIPAMERISAVLGCTVEFGVADVRIAAYELSQLDARPSVEHQLLLQSTILYDPKGILEGFCNNIAGKRFAALDQYYVERYVRALPFELYAHLEFHPMDEMKLQKSRQLQWVKWAVRALRDAVSSVSYLKTRRMLYGKDEVLAYYRRVLSAEDFSIVCMVYDWKINPILREKKIMQMLHDPEETFTEFRRITEKVEKIVVSLLE